MKLHQIPWSDREDELSWLMAIDANNPTFNHCVRWQSHDHYLIIHLNNP